MSDEKIEVTVAIVIDPGRGEAGTPAGEPGFLGDVGEGSVTIIAIERSHADKEAQPGEEQIGQAVIVVVTGGDGEAVYAIIEAGADANIGECAVPVVAIQTAARAGGGDDNVEVAVTVVIENRQASSGAGFVEPDLRGDIFEFDDRLLIA